MQSIDTNQRTTAALFDDWQEADRVVRELVDDGFQRQDISMIANRASCGPSIGPIENLGAEGRVGAGFAIGGGAGFATGLLALAIPGIGPILAAGPLAAGLTGAGIGAAAGGLIGALKNAGVSEDDAGCYCEAVRRGGVLLTVNVSGDRASRAADIMGRHRLIDLDECAAFWRETGWTGFDPERTDEPAERKPALPFNPDTIRASKQKERRERRPVRSYVRVR